MICRASVAACLVVVAACQHPARPQRAKRVPQRPAPVVEAPPGKYVEECSARFLDAPDLHKPNRSMAEVLISNGDGRVALALKNPEPADRAVLLLDARERYADALEKDNYSAEATFKLAVTYDRLYRKGCALVLLKRLGLLEGHPPSARAANALADQIADDRALFRDYRNDALAAIGR
jgi:hypothetical protein